MHRAFIANGSLHIGQNHWPATAAGAIEAGQWLAKQEHQRVLFASSINHPAEHGGEDIDFEAIIGNACYQALQSSGVHRLRPNTRYNIISIKVAVPADMDKGEVADGLNEMLRPATLCDDAVFHDYTFDLESYPNRKTSDDPCEGELFT